MSRPLGIELPGAFSHVTSLHFTSFHFTSLHVTSRGDKREAVYRDNLGRVAQIEVIAQAMDRFGSPRGWR